MVLILTVWNALRLYEVIRQREALQALSSPPPLGYLTVSALVWTVIGALLTFGLAYGKPWARRGTQAAALLYAAGYWLDRLLLADRAAIAVRWPFALGLTLAMLVFTFWVLSTPKARRFFSSRPT